MSNIIDVVVIVLVTCDYCYYFPFFPLSFLRSVCAVFQFDTIRKREKNRFIKQINLKKKIIFMNTIETLGLCMRRSPAENPVLFESAVADTERTYVHMVH